MLALRGNVAGLALVSSLLAGCGPSGTRAADAPALESARADGEPPRAAAPTCAPFRESLGPLPGVDPEHLSLEFWLTQLGETHDVDETLLTPDEIGRLGRVLAEPRPNYHAPHDLLAPLDPERLARDVRERREWARGKLTSGELVAASGEQVPASALESLGEEVALDAARAELRVALADTQIHCAPLRFGFYTPALDLRLDRNACSALRAQDVVRVLAKWPNGMTLVQARHAFGWLAPDAELSPVVPATLAERFVRGPAVAVQSELSVEAGGARAPVAVGTRLPASGEGPRRAWVATSNGFVQTAPDDAERVVSTSRPLTRRAFLEEAWRYVGTPYGLGDTGLARDCSRLVLDAFAAFGLHMPRHSAWQGQAGSFAIDVDAELGHAERTLLFDAALAKGIVLLDFPGHIMVYLGRDRRGEPMALHALGEYVERCDPARPEAGESVVRVKNIGVSTLSLGAGTSRRSLLERVTRITVVGGSPGPELAGVAKVRPALAPRVPADRQCKDSERAALYVMPERPNREQPLSVVAALADDPGPATLSLVDPAGRLVTPEPVQLGGPPYGRIVSVDAPRPGRWKAVLADGDHVLACQRIDVGARRPKAREPDGGPVWQPEHRWHAANEHLYSLFVERLFDYPLEQEHTWSGLHPLLRDPERNMLFDYRGLREDATLELSPDCADLPYTLRAYFAWKMRLPFGYQRCSRGRAGKPPRCDLPGAGDNSMSRLELPGKGGALNPRGDVEAFALFVNTQLRSGVHSSSGRALPLDETSDLYPVPLTRHALRPGTVFADPYGHLLVLSKWIAQPASGAGVLVGVDAQPDGTIAQRRFWRGTFLFDPDTESGGAGFKAFRPRSLRAEPVEAWVTPKDALEPVRVERSGLAALMSSQELEATTRFSPLSLEQYRGSADDFYDALERLISPRPLEAEVVLVSLVEAFEEAVSRRVVSVDNGEKWAREHPGEIIDMPEGDGIFLASGPWEDFSTPSRDLRLLISIDTVTGFSARVRRAPERFGVASASVAERVAALDERLAEELERRRVRYTRTDGSPYELTLAEVVRRAPRFEVAYNPNDCVEVRWGAAPESDEMQTCRRRAPEAQRAEMERRREWFSTRKRPPT